MQSSSPKLSSNLGYLKDVKKQITFDDLSEAQFDPNLSTEDNYKSDLLEFVGSYKEARRELDYDFHKNYIPERQLLQDKLMDLFLTTIIYDNRRGRVCEIPNEKW